MTLYHIVCRTCATDWLGDERHDGLPHEAVTEREDMAETLAEFHLEVNPGHDVVYAEI